MMQGNAGCSEKGAKAPRAREEPTTADPGPRAPLRVSTTKSKGEQSGPSKPQGEGSKCHESKGMEGELQGARTVNFK